MKDEADKLHEIKPAAQGLHDNLEVMMLKARRLVDLGAKHDRLATALLNGKVKGCEVKILTVTGIQATYMPPKLQMQIVDLIHNFYREESTILFDDIHNDKEKL